MVNGPRLGRCFRQNALSGGVLGQLHNGGDVAPLTVSSLAETLSKAGVPLSDPFTGEIYFLLSGRQRGGSQVASCINIYLKY